MRRALVAAALLAALVGAGVFAASVLGLASLGGERAAFTPTADPHGPVQVSRTRLQRILRATAAVNATTPKAELVAQGEKVFRSPAFFRTGESCQSCHTEGGADPDLGTVVHTFGPRDPPVLWFAAKTAPFLWTGTSPTLEAIARGTILGHFKPELTQDPNRVAELTAQLVAYLKTLDPPRTSFDEGTMSAAAIRGENLFRGKAGCDACHFGPAFTDNRIHNTNVPQVAGGTDPGAAAPAGGFNTPELRDVANTGPYMHNGVFTTLRQVVEFYNTTSSVAPLGLTQQDIDDLVAYLKAL